MGQLNWGRGREGEGKFLHQKFQAWGFIQTIAYCSENVTKYNYNYTIKIVFNSYSSTSLSNVTSYSLLFKTIKVTEYLSNYQTQKVIDYLSKYFKDYLRGHSKNTWHFFGIVQTPGLPAPRVTFYFLTDFFKPYWILIVKYISKKVYFIALSHLNMTCYYQNHLKMSFSELVKSLIAMLG